MKTIEEVLAEAHPRHATKIARVQAAALRAHFCSEEVREQADERLGWLVEDEWSDILATLGLAEES